MLIQDSRRRNEQIMPDHDDGRHAVYVPWPPGQHPTAATVPRYLLLSAHHLPLAWSQPGMLGAVVAVPLLAALYGVLGVGLGLLLRNTAAALGLALMWAFVVEGILPVLTHEPGMVRWLPEASANAVLHGASSTVTTLSAGAALAVLTGYAAALAAGGATVTTRREIGATAG
jgi:hypothetical protein